jgi:gluconolactonase
MKVDEKGNLFATGPGGVHVFAPDGTRLGRIETGVPTANVNWVRMAPCCTSLPATGSCV